MLCKNQTVKKKWAALATVSVKRCKKTLHGPWTNTSLSFSLLTKPPPTTATTFFLPCLGLNPSMSLSRLLWRCDLVERALQNCWVKIGGALHVLLEPDECPFNSQFLFQCKQKEEIMQWALCRQSLAICSRVKKPHLDDTSESWRFENYILRQPASFTLGDIKTWGSLLLHQHVKLKGP